MRGKRTMLKLSASEKSVSLRTVSKGFRSPHRFIVLDQELEELEAKRHIIVSDIHSFAEMQLDKAEMGDGDTLTVTFTWLSDAGGGKGSGMEERLRFPYQKLLEGIAESRSLEGTDYRLLSMEDKRALKIEFQSRNHLKEVAEVRMLRKKLGRFLACHFTWKSVGRVVVSDDFVPYSFFFREERPDGTGICGGIILHGQENLKKAYYGIHT